jgi:2-methylaconitate cis-trans-isomerase PrpF
LNEIGVMAFASGAESPDDIEASPGVMDTLEALRRQAGVVAGLADRAEAIGLQTPRIALVAPPARFRILDGETVADDRFDVATRMLSMQRAHRAVPGTGGLNLGVASQIAGTIPAAVVRRAGGDGEVRAGTPSGVVSVGAVVRDQRDAWVADSAVLYRTARRLMQGEVAIPSAAAAGWPG